MKKIILILFLITGSIFSLSSQELNKQEDKQFLSYYKPIYFLIGGVTEQAKFSVSFKYQLFETYGWYFAYEQLAFWDIYNGSSPFRETNYLPEIFYRNKTLLKEAHTTFQVSPYSHISNGEDKEDSRTIDRVYLSLETSLGTKYNLRFINTARYIFNTEKNNADIRNYYGPYEFSIKLSLNRIQNFLENQEIGYSFRSGSDKYFFKYGSHSFTYDIRPYLLEFKPSLFVELYTGYGESILNYDKRDTALRFGVKFKEI